jgi:endonuclease/exonuclease/phosphatase family metal-dependent hydrolase
MTDRDVVLARSGVGISQVGDGRFTAAVQFQLAGVVPVTIPRGWTSVVAQAGGATFRFVNTHLEIGAPGFADVQVAQAQELVAILNGSTLPTIAVGDLNSSGPPGASDTATYGIVTGAGFADAWTALRPAEPGATCCQDPALRNPDSQLTSRIDLVLYRGAFTPNSVDLVGEAPPDRTPSGVWPSDHAGVVASLRPPG